MEDIFIKMVIIVSMCFVSCTKQASKRKEPNILFILVDDLGWTDLGFTGSKSHETPNLDSLALDGMIFTNTYAASPICFSSRATILSRKYPERINLSDFVSVKRSENYNSLMPNFFKKQFYFGEFIIAEALKRAGYKTLFLANWHLGEQKKYQSKYQDFDMILGRNRNSRTRNRNFFAHKNPQHEDKGKYLTDRLTDEVIHFIKDNKDKPFFAYLSYYTLHLALQEKNRKVENQDKLIKMNYELEVYDKSGKTWSQNHQRVQDYAAMLENMDDNIGRLLKVLDDNGIADNTIIIFTSNNRGMSAGNRIENIPSTKAPFREGNGYLYEGGIRELLVVRWPEKIQGGEICETPVIGTDFYPTILDLANIVLPFQQRENGKSIKPILEGKHLEERPIFWHYPYAARGLGVKPSGAVRLGNYKLIEFYEDMHVELYNLKTDVQESNNLVEKEIAKTEELKTLLYQWRNDINVNMPLLNSNYKIN